jgi:Flp pilus assembly protein TadD
MRHFAFVLALLVSGCAPTPSGPPPARIDIEQQVGFTITEEVRITGNVRTDYDQAIAMFEQGRDAGGIALLEAVTKAAPNLSAPFIDLGVAYHRAGDLEAAEKNLKLALTSNPNHPIAHNELGIIYRKTGRFAEAKQSYQAALDIYPGYHYARRNLAVLCDLYLADLECALANYVAYMSTVPGDDEASIWIADIRQRLGQGE